MWKRQERANELSFFILFLSGFDSSLNERSTFETFFFFFFSYNAALPSSLFHSPLPQVQHLVPHPRVQVNVPAELIERLPRRRRGMRMKPAPLAALHEAQPSGRRQPEDAAAPADVSRGTHHCHGLVEHRLVTRLRVNVDRAQKAGLGRVGMDPSQREETPSVLRLEDIFFR